MNIDPHEFGWFLVDAYFETKDKADFVLHVQNRFPELKRDLLEGIWYALDEMKLR